MNEQFAAIALTNYHYLLREMKIKIGQDYTKNERVEEINKTLAWHQDYLQKQQRYIEVLTVKIAYQTDENEKLRNSVNWRIDDMKAKEAYIEELTARIVSQAEENERLQNGINWHIDDMKAKQAYIEELTAKGIKGNIKKIARKLQRGVFGKEI
jgi:uncharacterized coiled-coil protein SlyX